MSLTLAEQLKQLPESPGVYQYFNADGVVLYVGKAKNIKKRVLTYFNRDVDSFKTKLLVSQIHNVQCTVVETELDALLLENSLIKTYQPKYNILLKDDKTYPWIVIKNEPFPRVFYTRKKIKDGSRYFGPYPNVKTMQALLKLMHDLYKFRTCSLDLSDKKINQGKYKACLEFHLKRCLAPCEQQQSSTSYQKGIEEAEQIIKGEINPLIKSLTIEMLDHASNFVFEKAQEIKDLIDQLKSFQSRSTIVSSFSSNLDVFTWHKTKEFIYINFMVLKAGVVIHSYTSHVVPGLAEQLVDNLRTILFDLKQRFGSQNQLIISNEEIDLDIEAFKIEVPQKGEKRQIIELSLKNVQYHRLEFGKRKSISNEDVQSDDLLNELQKTFKLSTLPLHIECFDNSNFQGTNAVSACVVFKNGKPSKKDYRHFNVKTVEGPDDFSTMREVVYRRYKRLIDEGQTLPELIVIDGGKGQLSAALEAIESLDIRGKVAVVGIAKKLEEIFFPGDQFPIQLNRRSKSLKLIQFMRNEAHRFGITHHRNKRSKSAISSELDQISGIGEKTKQILLNEYKTISNIKKFGFEEVTKKIGQSKATILFNYFKRTEN
ncbi:MAG: excinuclease ABC subunit UvrC [Crocinitomicaceae bacterium]